MNNDYQTNNPFKLDAEDAIGSDYKTELSFEQNPFGFSQQEKNTPDTMQEMTFTAANPVLQKNNNTLWFTLLIPSGSELKFVKKILDWNHSIVARAVVPRKVKKVLKKGRESVTETKLYPGYIFIEIVNTAEAFPYQTKILPEVVKNFVEKIALEDKILLRKQENLYCLPPEDVSNLVNLLDKIDKENSSEGFNSSSYEEFFVDQEVNIIGSPFSKGTIATIDKENRKLHLKVRFFGQEVNINIDMTDAVVPAAPTSRPM
jgi:transcription antitermination factor NusG